MISQDPLYDASMAIAHDIIIKGKETIWSETDLAAKLRQYVRKGSKKMQTEIQEKKDKRDCLKSYVDSVVHSMSCALSSRNWFAEEDFGPLLAAGLEEVQPRPFWARRGGMQSVKDTIYEFYDEATKSEDFDNALWNTVTHHIRDGTQQHKAYSFFTRAYRKAEKDLEEGKSPSSERNIEKFCGAWAADSMWRIWQSEAAEVPVNMVVELLFNLIKMKLLPSKLTNNFERGGPIQCQNAFRKLLTKLYAEANVDVKTGRHLPEPQQAGAKRARDPHAVKLEPAPQRVRLDARDVDRRHKPIVLVPKVKLERYVPPHCRPNRAEEVIEQAIEEDMEEEIADAEAAELEYISDEEQEDEVVDWDAEPEDGEEYEDVLEDEAEVDEEDQLEVEEDHLEVEEDQLEVEEDQLEAEEDIEEEADGAELVCVSVSKEACVGTPIDKLIREKNSGWIFCESCFFQLQDQQDVEYEGEYVTD
eukprot:GEMP01020908.1.p1 GENE.GEMP01020908.1~~GEMP01020908.1.p1  ORF type:complete len:474 (+),score=140.96 GEMP01020908.1:417-1838(+)